MERKVLPKKIQETERLWEQPAECRMAAPPKDAVKACGFHCIKVRNLGVKLEDEVILENINLHIHCGRLISVIGKNGAGKSTFIRAILGEVPHTGTIEFRDMRNPLSVQKQKMANSNHLRIGYVPQHLNIEKNTPTSVYDLFASFITRVPVFLWKKKSVEKKIRAQLALFQAEELLERRVCDLSGGQLQRVLLSMAVYPLPNLLLLDEPVSGIDKKGMDSFYQTIDRLKKTYDMSILMVSHDLEYVKRYSDSVVLMDKTILKRGAPEDVFNSIEYKTAFLS